MSLRTVLIPACSSAVVRPVPSPSVSNTRTVPGPTTETIAPARLFCAILSCPGSSAWNTASKSWIPRAPAGTETAWMFVPAFNATGTATSEVSGERSTGRPFNVSISLPWTSAVLSRRNRSGIVWPLLTLTGAATRRNNTSASWRYRRGRTSMGIPLAAAALAASFRSPSVWFPSLARTIRTAVSGGAIAMAIWMPCASRLPAPVRTVFLR